MCHECKRKTKDLVQCLRRPWTVPVKLCAECVKRTQGRRWYD